jgi:serine protease Do
MRMPSHFFSPFLSVFFTLFLGACASGYKQFYKERQGMTPEIIAAMRVAPPRATPKIERAQPGDCMKILDAYAKRGFTMIGSSMFTSGHPESEDSAVRQAQAVGADVVLILNPRYAGMISHDAPITTLTRTRSTRASLYSDDITYYVPVTIPLTDYGALYFVKQRSDLGMFNRDLHEAERLQFQTDAVQPCNSSLMGAPP